MKIFLRWTLLFVVTYLLFKFLIKYNDNDVFPKNVNFIYNNFLKSSTFFKGDYDLICVLPSYASKVYPDADDSYKINEKIKNKITWKFMFPSDGDWKIILSKKNSDDIDVYSISGGYVVYENNFAKFNKDEYFIKSKFSGNIILNKQCFLFEDSGFFVVDRPFGDLFFFAHKSGVL